MASKWIGAATKKMDEKGTKGSFRRIAHKMGKSTHEAANEIMNDPDASPSERKKANFARNVAR